MHKSRHMGVKIWLSHSPYLPNILASQNSSFKFRATHISLKPLVSLAPPNGGGPTLQISPQFLT